MNKSVLQFRDTQDMNASSGSPSASSGSECLICVSEKEDFEILPCKHSCCVDCFGLLKKCHLCRGPIFKVMKADMILELKMNVSSTVPSSASTHVTIPFYYTEGVPLLENTQLSGYTRKIDHMLLDKTYDIAQSVIEVYGFNCKIQSYKLINNRYDEFMTSRCKSEHNISRDNETIAEDCIDYNFIAKHICPVRGKISDNDDDCTCKSFPYKLVESMQSKLQEICLELRKNNLV